MRIYIASTLVEGPTRRDAVTRALQRLGLRAVVTRQRTAVIPADSFVFRSACDATAQETLKAINRSGHAASLAFRVEDRPGQSAWAGLGWVVETATGHGRFARCQGNGRRQIVLSLHETLERWCVKQTEPFEPIQTEIIGGVCHLHPICALVVAVVDSRRRQSVRRQISPGGGAIHTSSSPTTSGLC